MWSVIVAPNTSVLLFGCGLGALVRVTTIFDTSIESESARRSGARGAARAPRRTNIARASTRARENPGALF
jgi:hypothetical protein